MLLFGLFGWKVAGLYLGTGLVIAIVAGWIIGRLKLERHVEDWVYATKPGANGLADAGASAERVQRVLDWHGNSRGALWLRRACGLFVLAGSGWLVVTAAP